MLANDLVWNNPNWDAPNLDFNNGLPKIPQAYYQSNDQNINLDLADRRLVIGFEGTETDLPEGLRLIRPIHSQASIYEADEALSPALIAVLEDLPGVAYTAPVFVNTNSSDELALLNEVIVTFKSGESAERYFAESHEFASFRRLDGTSDQYVATLRNGFGRATLSAALSMADHSAVEWAAPNFYQDWEQFYSPNDARILNQWPLNNFGQSGGAVDADSDLFEAWDVNQGGSANIVIGIIDDGIQSNHPDLNLWVNPGETNFDGIDNDGNGWVDDINGWNFVANSNQTEPVGTDQHGTNVAGVAAARGDNTVGIAGAAYRSRVMPIKIFENGVAASDADIASAIYYASGRTRNGLGTWKSADIVTSAWGSGSPSAVINAALNWGTVNGRQGVGTAYFFGTGNNAASTISEPAAQSANIPGVIAVGATNNFGTRSNYSNYGTGLDIVAPSSDTRAGYLSIDTTDRTGAAGFGPGDYTGIANPGFGGTSAAAAFASGIGALVLAQAGSQNVTLTPSALRGILRNSTDLNGGAIFDVLTGTTSELGYGRVNANAAVRNIGRPELSIISSTAELDSFSTVVFAPIAVGLFTEVSLRVRNQGTAPLNLDSITTSGPFSVTSSGSSNLAVGETTIITLRFSPTALGSFFGTAVVNSNDADESVFSFSLFGSASAASIAGNVFEDYDGDGTFDLFEDYLNVPGAFAYIDANDNGTFNTGETRVNIANGGYAFEGLAAGTYIVRTEVTGWSSTFPDKNRHLVVLSSATDSKVGLSFGLSKNDRLYSFLYEEINQNGTIDPGEPPLPGFTVSGSHAYTVTNNTAVPIPAIGSINSTINVVDPGSVVSLNVLVNIDHTWDSDLNLTLTAPNGLTILLAQNVGGNGDNFTNTRFSDGGATSIAAGTAPFTGTFRPLQPLNLLNTSIITGTWRLTVNDTKDFDSGTLRNWSLEFTRRFFGVSDENGWALVDLPTGTNIVSAELQPNWLYSRPANGQYSITSNNAPVYNRPFGLFYDNVEPTDLLLSNNRVDENLPIDAFVGSFSSVDPNRTGNTFTYTLVPGPRPYDNAQFRIIGNQLVTNAIFDFETKNSYLIRVRTTDAGGKFLEKEFAIQVNDVVDPTGSISGIGFEDYDRDGVFSFFERRIQDPAAFAYIDNNDNGTWEGVEQRAFLVNGQYSFTGLAQGAFVIRTELPGWTITFPDKNRHLVQLATSTSAATGVNFGRSKNDRLYSYVYEEINQDGTINAGEPALPGFVVSGVQAVTATNTTATNIPANGTITSTINVGLPGTIVGLNVLVNIDHTWDSDLTLTLTAPNGTSIILASAVGGNGDNFTNTRFSDAAATSINAGTPPFTGSFRPQQPLNVLNGANLAGTWTLTVNDNRDFDSGVLRNWSLEFQRRYFAAADQFGWALLDLPTNTTSTIGVELQTNWLYSRPLTGQYSITTTGVPVYDRPFGLFFDNIAPTDIQLSKSNIDENLPPGSLVGLLSSIDPNRFGNTFTYTLVSGPTANDNIQFRIVGNQLVSATVFNFEAKPSYLVRIRSTDAGGKFLEKEFTIAINDLVDPTATISGLVFEDFDGNGTRSSFERPVTDPALFAYIDDNDNGIWEVVERRVSTTNGVYNFTGLAAGSFVIRTELPGWSIVAPDKNRYMVTLATDSSAATGLDFARSKNDRLYSLVYQEINEDNVRNAGEPGLPGFAISGVLPLSVSNSTAVNIPAIGTATSTINVGLSGTVAGLTVLVNIDHTWDSDLTLQLTGPSGQTITLASAVGGSGDNFTNTRFSDTGTSPIASGSPPFTGTFIPQQALSAFVGSNIQGNWTLRAIDGRDFDSGVIRNWSIDFQRRYFAVSDQNGWAILDIPTTSATIGVELQPDWRFSNPMSGQYAITTNGTPLYNRPFGLFLLNAAPTNINLSNAVLNENLPVGTSVGTLTTIDPNPADTTFVYTLVSGPTANDNSLFQITGDQLQTNAVLNFESKSSYVVRVRSTDSGGRFLEKEFTIALNNVNEAPTSLTLTPQSVNENQPINTLVGTFASTDDDAGDTHSYSLVTGTGSTDNASFLLIGNTLVTQASFNFEAKSSYSIRARVQDQLGAFLEQVFTISVLNINEGATSITLSSNSILEGRPVNSLVGNFTNNDPDTGNTFTYAFVSGTGSTDNGAFRIVGNQLRSNQVFDFETQNTFSIRVRVTDQGGLFTESILTVTVIDQNEVPTRVSLTGNIIQENLMPGILIGMLATDDPDTADVTLFQFSNTVTPNDNQLFSIQGNQLFSAVSLNFEPRSTYQINVRGTDRSGAFAEGLFTITVTNINEAPTDISLSNAGFMENAPVGTAIGVLTATDEDANDSHSWSLVPGNGDNDNAKFQIVGNQIRTNAAFDYETKQLHSVRIRTTDSNGLTFEKIFNISILNENEAPTGYTLSPTSITEGLPIGTIIGNLTALDPDIAGAHHFDLVNLANFPDNANFTIDGNSLRSNAVFDFDIRSSYTIMIRVSDQADAFIDQAVTITILDTNASSTDIVLDRQSVEENKPVGSLVGSFSTIDPDGTDTFTYQLISGTGATDNNSFSVVGRELRTNASLNFEAKSAYSIRVQSRDSGGATLEKVFVITVLNVNEAPTSIALSPSSVAENSPNGTQVGTLSTVDPDLADTFSYNLVSGTGSQNNGSFVIVGNSIRTNSILNFEQSPSYSIRVRSTDAGGLGVESVFVITVTNVNESPTNLQIVGSLLENTPTNVSSLSVQAADVDAGDMITYTLVSGTGADDNANFSLTPAGVLQHLTIPNFEVKPSYSIRVKATDAGGLSIEGALSINIVDINEAPSDIALSANTLAENQPSGVLIGILSALDQDVNDSRSFSLVSGIGSTDNSAFQIAGNQLLSNASFDFESKNSYSIRVQATDAGGLSTEQELTIQITNVNEAPTGLSLNNNTIQENLPAGFNVGLLATQDADVGDQFVYSLVVGNGSDHNNLFSIVGNTLRASTTFNFESQTNYSIRIRSTDAGGLTTEAPFIITVLNVNELPTNFGLSPSTVLENTPTGTLVGLLSATDPDAGDAISYRFVNGTNDNARFTISGNQLLTAQSFDFESSSSYSVQIQAVDASLNGPTQPFTIMIVNVNEPVVDIRLSSQIVDENRPIGTVVGMLSALDPDANDSHQFSLVSGVGSEDNSKFAIIGNELRLASIPDFETQSSYSIRVRSSDIAGLGYERNFTINVRNVSEAPQQLSLSNSHISENAGASALVGLLSAIDPDANEVLVFALVPGLGSSDNALFAIDSNRLIARNSLDHETQSNLSVRVRVTDSTQQSTEATFLIIVDNAPEAPSGIQVSSTSISENRPAGTLVGTISTVDPEGGTFTYSLVPTASSGDNAFFEIVGNELHTRQAFNFEAKSVYQITIRSTDTSGLFLDAPVVIQITNVAEQPPVANADSVITPTNRPIIIPVLANDTDSDGTLDISTLIIVAQPVQGSVRVLNDGSIEYTPPVDANVDVTFQYAVRDNDAELSNSAIVSVHVFPAFQNPRNRYDVDNDGSVTPLDVLTLINDINSNGFRDLPNNVAESVPYLDPNGNSETDPLDVLEVINFINLNPSGEGESQAGVVGAMASRGQNAHNVDALFAGMDLQDVTKKQTKDQTFMTSLQSVDDYYREISIRKNKRT